MTWAGDLRACVWGMWLCYPGVARQCWHPLFHNLLRDAEAHALQTTLSSFQLLDDWTTWELEDGESLFLSTCALSSGPSELGAALKQQFPSEI